MTSEFDPVEILRTLNRHGVEFVVIGGFAATVRGSAHVTFDIDVVPEESPENLANLAAALADLAAAVRVSDSEESLPFAPTADQLSGNRIWDLDTRAGALDLVLEPAGLSGYEDAARGAAEIEVADKVTIHVATLDTIIRSKAAADRPKDRAVLDELRRLRERLD